MNISDTRILDQSEVKVWVRDTASQYELPEEVVWALRDYVVHRQPTGDFLRAVLSNDFVDAATRADSTTRHFLKEIAVFVFNAMPLETWGGPDTVTAWLAGDDTP